MPHRCVRTTRVTIYVVNLENNNVLSTTARALYITSGNVDFHFCKRRKFENHETKDSSKAFLGILMVFNEQSGPLPSQGPPAIDWFPWPLEGSGPLRSDTNNYVKKLIALTALLSGSEPMFKLCFVTCEVFRRCPV